MSTFGDKLKQIRLERNLTQEELASRLNTTKQVISRYEKNQRTPKISIAQEYAKALDAPISYLIDDDENTMIISEEFTDLYNKLSDAAQSPRFFY